MSIEEAGLKTNDSDSGLGSSNSKVTEVTAPAKLTVSLRILGRRKDGYHEVTAECVALDFYDTLLIEDGKSGFRLHADPFTRIDDLEADENNLVAKALKATGREASVVLMKRIPVGAGLGGGSSNAAAVLRWAKCQDTSLAQSLGADVPFSLIGGRAKVSGLGEKVEPLPFEKRTFTLMMPPVSVKTSLVYRVWDFIRTPQESGSNDLLIAALRVEPSMARWRDLFGSVTGIEPSLAGSGSTWFVEGGLDDLGIPGRDSITFGKEQAFLREVHTVPPDWKAP